jgi:predicted kinase
MARLVSRAGVPRPRRSGAAKRRLTADRRAPRLVVVTGPPASGKTTVARAVADALGWPLLTKDALKETLFDELGVADRAWSSKIGGAAMSLLYLLLDVELRAGRSVIVEANFSAARANAEFAALPPFRPVQVYCHGDPDELVARFRARRGRHPGHRDDDAQALADAERAIRDGRAAPLDLDGPLVEWSVGSRDVAGVVGDVLRLVGSG